MQFLEFLASVGLRFWIISCSWVEIVLSVQTRADMKFGRIGLDMQVSLRKCHSFTLGARIWAICAAGAYVSLFCTNYS